MPEELSDLNNDDSPIINPTNNNIFLSTQINSQKPQIEEENNMFEETTEQYTVEQASEKIKELIENLRIHGINIKTDEMNFEKSYQIIIKIDKTEVKE